jgi:hypothetical protein
MGLQRQCDFFQRMGHRRRLARSAAFNGADFRKNAAQTLFDRVVGRQFEFYLGAGHDGFNGRVTTPQIGTAQRANS